MKIKILWSCAAFLLLCSCQFRVPKDPYTLVQSISSDPETLNPVLATTAYAGDVYGLVYEQLFGLNKETLEPEPKLAKRWEIAPDHLRYTFYLRDDVRWQDGRPFTADDVIYTYQTIMDPRVDAASLRNYYRDISKAEKIDSHTVRFTYRRPYEGTLTTIGLMVIIPKHVFDDGRDFNTHPNNRVPVGTGPFQLAEWSTGNYIALKRFEGHWNPEYRIRRMLFKIVPDSLTAFQLFKKGEIDLIDLPALQWARQTESKKFERQFVKHKLLTPFSSTYSYIGWNLKRIWFKERGVRQALAHLLDKNLLNRKLLFDLYYPVTGPYYPFGEKYNRDLKPIDYNLMEAEKLLDAAGWKRDKPDGLRRKNGIPFRFTLLFAGGGTFAEQLTPILRQNFLRAGIDVELVRLEGITMFQRVHEHDFDAYLAAWGRGVGEDLYQIWHSSQAEGGSNYVRYDNPEVDRLLEEARREFDKKKQALICRRIHKILYEDQPYLFLFARPDLIARNRRFGNVKEYPKGLELKEWEIEE